MDAGPSPKRKSADWENLYFCCEENGQWHCLICNVAFTSGRQFNIRRHYEAKHLADFDNLEGDERQQEILRLKTQKQADVDVDKNEPSEGAVAASYKIASLIAKHLMKPFGEGEFAKERISIVADCLCPDMTETVERVSLSRRTIGHRINDLAANCKEQLKERAVNFIEFSLAFDGSSDYQAAEQLAIFVRGVDSDLNVTEELLDLVPMKECTTGADMFACVDEAMDPMGLKWIKLRSVSTDGTPAMISRAIGFVAQVNKKLMSIVRRPEIISIHCIIHQEDLCAEVCDLPGVIPVVKKAIHSIRKVGLKHGQFKDFLTDLESEYGDVRHYTEVRWLSRGRALSRFFALREEINVFFEMLEAPVSQLQDETWVADLAFLTDIVGHLNNLNVSLRGRDKLIVHLRDSIRAFKMKLNLWDGQLMNGNVTHFRSLESLPEGWDRSRLNVYADIVKNLENAFDERFQEFDKLEPDLKIFATPFACVVEESPAYYQSELIDLQCDTELTEKYRTRKNLTDFYRGFPRVRFPRLHRLAAKMLCLFGSTYICEKLFSIMNLTKCKERSGSTDCSWQDSLRVAVAQQVQPNIVKLVASHRIQSSKKKR